MPRSAREATREAVTAAAEHRLRVGDEDPLDRELKERAQALAQIGRRDVLGQLAVGADADATRAVSQEHVGGARREMLAEEEDTSVRALRIGRLGRHERVDRHYPVRRLEVDAPADFAPMLVRLPLRVWRRSVPEALRNLLDAHGV